MYIFTQILFSPLFIYIVYDRTTEGTAPNANFTVVFPKLRASSKCFNTAFNWLNFILYNIFMSMDSEKNWANGGTTEQTRNANG